MTTIKKPKKQKLRNAEYYDLQATFDKLYLESKNGKTFTKIMPIILSENNIRLAYRNLKRNSGSKTAGTDNKTIKDLETWKEPDLVRCAQTAGMVHPPARAQGGNRKGQREDPSPGNPYYPRPAYPAMLPASSGTHLRSEIPRPQLWVSPKPQPGKCRGSGLFAYANTAFAFCCRP